MFEDSSVSKQKDLSRIVSSSAYLLFYRRRSDVPLGGPRFKQIVSDDDNAHDQSEDEQSESGEDRGLAGNNSSLRGSSSALTGVGAALHLPNHGSDGVGMTTINPSALEALPPYEAHEDQFRNTLQPSVERDEDEAIDVNDDRHYNTFGPPNIGANWTFAGLNENNRDGPSGAASDMDDVPSDMAANDSSADEMEKETRLSEFDNAEAEDYIDQSPVPDLDDEGIASAVAMQADLFENMRGNPIYHLTADDTERLEVEEPAMEIHIEEDEEM